MQESDIFRIARKLSGNEQACYLEEACAGNAELRLDIDALLQVHERQQGSTHHQSMMVQDTQVVPPNAIFAERYRLRELLGQGGMGLVYLADQQEPIHRQVAIKIIRTRFATPSIISRFEQERQALALMDHPNIARVYDAGMASYAQEQLLTTESNTTPIPSTPYLVMEYIAGLPVNQYCLKHQLSIRERVELFIPVCQAIQHAHQKGIIHRDLKPSNILVIQQDGKPVAKVIDFGIAKVVEHKITEQNIQTEVGAIVGTLEYMSPEQAQLKNQDIDTRADIYSLGVILYEMISGSLPLTREEFSKCGLHEALEIIQHKELSKPSSKLTDTALKEPASSTRLTDIRKARQQIQGDLDWIVMKCLEKDRNRRYQTALQLGLELERFLRNEPVHAGPPNWMYKFSKLFQRHRLKFIAAVVVLASLLMGTVATSIGMVQARDAERMAIRHASDMDIARQQEVLLRQAVEKERDKVEEEKQIAESISNFLRNKLLIQGNYRVQSSAMLEARESLSGLEHDPKISVLLNRTEKELSPENIQSNFPNQPAVQAALLHTVGVTYLGIGKVSRAIPLLERALHRLPPDDSTKNKHWHYQNSLAVAYVQASKPKEAIALLEKLITEVELNDIHHNVPVLRCNLASAYEDLGDLKKALELKKQAWNDAVERLGDKHQTTIVRERSYAGTLLNAGKYQQAIAIYQRLRGLQADLVGVEHAEYFVLTSDLANALLAINQASEANVLLEELVGKTKSKLGDSHPIYLSACFNLAACHRFLGRPQEALALFEEVYQKRVSNLGDGHPDCIETANYIGAVYRDLGKLPEARKRLEQTSQQLIAIYGKSHYKSLMSLSNLGAVLFAMERYQEGMVLLKEVIQLQTMSIGDRHLLTLKSKQNLAALYSETGQFRESLQLVNEIEPGFTEVLGRNHSETIKVRCQRAICMHGLGQHPEAIILLKEVLELQIKAKQKLPFICITRHTLGACYFALKKWDLAIEQFQEAAKGRELALGANHPRTLMSLQNLANCYSELGRKKEALEKTQLVRQTRSQHLGKEHIDTLNSTFREAYLLMELLRIKEATVILEELLPLNEAKRGKEHDETVKTQSLLAKAYWSSRQFTKAIPLYQQILQVNTRKYGASDQRTMLVKANLAINYKDAGMLKDAMPHLEAIYRSGKQYQSGFVANALLDCYLRAQPQSAEPVFLTIIAELRNKQTQNPSRSIVEWMTLSTMLISAKSPEKALVTIDETLNLYEKTPTQGARLLSKVSLARVYSLKGEVLLQLNRTDESLKMLTRAYELFPFDEEVKSAIAYSWMQEHLDKLIQIYTVKKDPAEIERWKQTKTKFTEQYAKAFTKQ